MTNRYEIRYGRFGAYFYDTRFNREMDLNAKRTPNITQMRVIEPVSGKDDEPTTTAT